MFQEREREAGHGINTLSHVRGEREKRVVRKGQSKSRENFQARRRNYIGSEWNISSTSPPFDEIEREGRANSPSSSSRSPLSVPPQLRIINGQFAASAADCIVSLFSGFPSFRCQALSLCLSLFIFPSSSLSFARIRTPQFLELPPLSLYRLRSFLKSCPSFLPPSRILQSSLKEARAWAGHDVT